MDYLVIETGTVVAWREQCLYTREAKFKHVLTLEANVIYSFIASNHEDESLS